MCNIDVTIEPTLKFLLDEIRNTKLLTSPFLSILFFCTHLAGPTQNMTFIKSTLELVSRIVAHVLYSYRSKVSLSLK